MAARPQTRLQVIEPLKLPAPRNQIEVDFATLLAQVRHDCRDLALVVEVLEARPELRGRAALIRGISVQMDGFVSRLNRLRRTLLPLVVGALLVSGAGCAVDLNKLIDSATRHTVTLVDPPAWDCQVPPQKMLTKQGMEVCDACRNTSPVSQGVRVDSTPELGVESGQHVFICPSGTVIVQARQP